ncbi:hypothetical protein [Prosthecobacter sp.]|jgi:hypothetical protein|uniref:hypothetical protein n=1 Tax=Prosthecobacter sp. TaxID=1965333 RepID=UPI00378430BD
MPATTIALGFGHLPQDHAKNTELDVHLHLDHPATPISMGERSGPQSTGSGYTLQQATEYRMEEHLRACGCDWLRQVAAEERLSGRIFTPEEILVRKPATIAVSPPPARLPNKQPPAGALEKIRRAIAAQDFEEIEGLRDVLNDELVREIAAEWRANLPWGVKDAYAALLMDQTADCVQALYQDALRSPTVESRAYAVCVLTRDFSRFDAMLVDGGLDEARVDAQVAAFNSRKP